MTATAASTEAMIEALNASMGARLLPDELRRLAAALMRRLARGRPVSPAELQLEPGRDVRQAIGELAELGMAERDAAGSVIGCVVTVKPTRHHFETATGSAWTWCAADTLFLPAVLGAKARVASACGATGAPVHATVAPDRIVSLEPATAAVSLVAPGITPGIEARCGGAGGLTGSAGTFCTRALFFASPEAAAGWLDDNPGALVVPVAEAFEVARRVWGEPLASAALPPGAAGVRAPD
jgi:alkylmercury lyase